MAEEQNNRQAMLKTSFFGGFDKKEVLAYIDRLREENTAAQSELDRRLSDMTAARGQLAEQVSGFEKKIGEMESALNERSDRIRSLTGQLDTLQGELTYTKKKQDDTGKQLRLQEEQNRFLLERAKKSETQAQKYAEVSEKIGDMMISAQQAADKIVADARTQAEQLQSETDTASERLAGEFQGMRDELTRLREQMAELVECFSNRITEAEELIDSLEARTITAAPEETPAAAESSAAGDSADTAHRYTAARSGTHTRPRTRVGGSDLLDRLFSRK